ncbi:MAG: sigma 54-interacting transcriptional regulator [Planctomycetota bacterium]
MSPVPTVLLLLALGIGSLATPLQAEVVEQVEIAELDQPPLIDGRLDEWRDRPALKLSDRRQVAQESQRWPWEGPGDASAVLYVGADATSLYLAGEIRDDHIVPDESIWWHGDAIEVFVDTDLQGDRDIDTYNEDDFQIFLMPMSPSRRWGVSIRDARLSPSDGGFVGVEVSGREREGGYTFEAAIPLANFPGLPEEPGWIGFDLALLDNDWPREGEADSCYLTLNGETGLFEHPARFLMARFPACAKPEENGGAGRLGAVLLRVLGVIALLSGLFLLTVFARRLHRLVLAQVPGWRRVGAIVLSVLALSVLVVPGAVVAWFEGRAMNQLKAGLEVLRQTLDQVRAAGLFDRWPGLTQPQTLLDFLRGIGVEPRLRYDYAPLPLPGVGELPLRSVASLPFRVAPLRLEAGRSTVFELPACVDARELYLAVQTRFAEWQREAPVGHVDIADALHVTLEYLGGSTRKFNFALDDGALTELADDHDTSDRWLGYRQRDGHADVLVARVEEFYAAGGLMRVTMRPMQAGIAVELLGLTAMTSDGPLPIPLGQPTLTGVPTLLDGRAETLAQGGLVARVGTPLSIAASGAFDTIWLIYEIQDPTHELKELEGDEVARLRLCFADTGDDIRVALRVGQHVSVSGGEPRASDMESRVAFRYSLGRTVGYLESLEIAGLARRPLKSFEVQCLEARCPVRVAAVTGGVEAGPGPLSPEAPVTVARDGRQIVLRPDVARAVAPIWESLRFDVAVDGIVQASTLGHDLHLRHIGTPLSATAAPRGAGPALRQHGDREYWTDDITLQSSPRTVTLRAHAEIVGRQAVYRARRGVVVASGMVLLPFVLLFLVDWVRRFKKIRWKLTTLLIVTSVLPIVLLSLLVLRIVDEERQRAARARGAELVRSVQTKTEDLNQVALDGARNALDDPRLMALAEKVIGDEPPDERQLERELRRIADSVSITIPVAVRLTVETAEGQHTFRASPDPRLDPSPDFAGRGMVYDWGEVHFRGTAERLDSLPRIWITVGGVIDSALLSAVDLRADESVALYSLDRQIGERHLPGGIQLAGTLVGNMPGAGRGIPEIVEQLRSRSEMHFQTEPSGRLAVFDVINDRQGQPVAVLGVTVSAAPFTLDLIIGAVAVDWLLIVFGAVMLAAALFLGGLVTDDITIPIERLEQAARAVSGRRSAPEPVSPAGDDEVGRLTDAYNFMARELDKRMGEQERLRTLQMEMASCLGLEDRIRIAMRFLGRELRPQSLHLLLYDREHNRLVERSLADGAEKESFARSDTVLFGVLGAREPLRLGPASRDERRAAAVRVAPALFAGDEPVHLVALGEPGKEVGVVVARFSAESDPLGWLSSDYLANVCNLIAASIENARLYQLAIEDPVTGLLVHSYLMRRLTAELDRSDAADRGVTLLKIKVRDYDAVQRDVGGDAAAEVMRWLARALERACRPMDVLGCDGADELEVLLPEGGQERAEAIAGAVAKELPEIRYPDGNRSRVQTVHASATYPQDGKSREFLMSALAKKLQAAQLAPEKEDRKAVATGSGAGRPLSEHFPDFVFKSAGTREILDQVARVAASRATVMILGETGVGKEVIAHVIHQVSDRAAGPFVAVHCSALPETLLESELFGHERGAFTGADRQKIGRFEQAHRGTLFLDEVGEMSSATQVKLLRVLQEHRIQRLGGQGEIEVDVRILTATNRNLEQMVKEGAFREDLYYRLKVITITIPPLRERKEEIPELVDLFIRQHNRELGRDIRGVDPSALDKLFLHSWPGNVRELRNVIHRAAVLCQGDRIEAASIQLEPARGSGTPAPGEKVFGGEPMLNERQRRLLRLLGEKGSVTNKEYFESVGVSRRTALRDLTDLMERGLIVRRGHRRASHYQLARAQVGGG